ncbi:MAG: CHAT domain-containing protein [Bacteroidetes bacterium]|nr:MAG: CHAT domain-containing protein [Bacteroidota bacterium]
MLTNPRIPVAFLACANSYRKGKRLRYLVHERKALARMLDETHPPLYQAVQKGNLPHHVHFDLLRKHDYYDRVEILHFSGHADNNYLRLESDEFETPVGIEELSRLVGSLPNLKIVFLSGCATPGLVDMLLRRDVPLVIATQSWEKDEQVSDIARRFYRALTQGGSLQQIIEKRADGPHGMQAIEVDYEVETDTLQWQGAPLPFERNRLAWGFYFLRDNLPKLRQRLVRRHPVIPLPIDAHYAGTYRQRFVRRMLSYSLSAIVIGLLAVGITLLLRRPDDVVHLFAYWGVTM